MSGINTGRAAGKSRGRRRDDDVTRSTTISPPEAPDSGEDSSDEQETTPIGPSGNASDPQRETSGKEGSSRGRPRELAAPFRTTVTLEETHVDFLDNTAARVKLSGGSKLSRGAILRALVEAIMHSDVDLSAADDEGELSRILLNRLR